MADAALTMFPEDGDGGALGAGDVAEDQESTRSGSKGVTPVCVKGAEKKITCRLCNAKATDKGPSAKLDPDGKYGGHWPWAQYAPNKESGSIVSRTPIGRLCAPCRNVFCLSGLNAKYETVPKIVKIMGTPEGTKLHKEFLKKQKLYLDSVRDREDTREGHSARASGQALKKIRETALTTERSRGSRVAAPQREFVESASWDVALDGVFDPSKEI